MQLVKRGEYLVNSIGCDDCHSPKKMGPNGPEVDMSLRLSGYPAQRPLQPADSDVLKNGWVLFGSDLTSAIGPWGASFAANITSDDTGIGKWTEAQFMKAIREGKSKGLDGSRPLLPPMPWQNFKKLNDEDLKSINATPFDGNSYYRIKSVDKSGKTTYTRILPVTLDNNNIAGHLSIYPNPLKGKSFQVQISNKAAGTYTISLISNSGQQLFTQSIRYSGGTAIFNVRLKSALAAGLYFIKAIAADGSADVIKAVVQ